jgi:curved DNA-binding protein CbpA
MKYHPDVNTTGETHSPNADKFREIAEAYAVLSIPENKMSYDLTYNKNQEAVFSSVKSETMEKNRKMRDRSGHVPGPEPMRGSYAEFRMKALEKEREKYNVNHLGYYNGGLPVKGSEKIRKGALGPIGAAHSKDLHNYYERFDRDSHEVSPTEAADFKVFKHNDRDEITREKPYYKLEADYEWTSVKNRAFATLVILAIFGYTIANKVFRREKTRMHQAKRHPDNLSSAPAHHYVNRGGVLLKKEFVGFEKYIKNDKQLTQWYNKVYPNIE